MKTRFQIGEQVRILGYSAHGEEADAYPLEAVDRDRMAGRSRTLNGKKVSPGKQIYTIVGIDIEDSSTISYLIVETCGEFKGASNFPEFVFGASATTEWEAYLSVYSVLSRDLAEA